MQLEAVEPRREVGQQIDARRIRPLQVLEQQHERPPTGDRSDRRHERRELARHAVAGTHAGQGLSRPRLGFARHARKVHRPGGCELEELRHERLALAAREEIAQRVEKGRVGLRRPEVLGRTPEGQAGIRGGEPRPAQEGVRQGRLAGPRLAGDGDQLPAAGGGRLQQLGEQRELFAAPDRFRCDTARTLAHRAPQPCRAGTTRRRPRSLAGRRQRRHRERRHRAGERVRLEGLLESGEKLAGAGGPRIGVLGQRSQHGERQRPAETRLQCVRRARFLGEVGEENLLRRAAAKRHLAGEQGVGDDAEAVDVARGARRPSLALLGAHVERRTDRVPAGQPGILALEHPREAEVGDLGDLAGEQDVARLEIAVHDPLAMRRIDRRGDPREEGDDRGAGQRAGQSEMIGEITAVAVLHGEVGLALFRAAEIEHRHGVGMHQRAGGAGLAAKTREGDRRGEELGVEHLDRHRAIHLLVQRAIDHARTTLADAREKPVAPVEKAPQSGIGRSHDDFTLTALSGSGKRAASVTRRFGRRPRRQLG